MMRTIILLILLFLVFSAISDAQVIPNAMSNAQIDHTYIVDSHPCGTWVSQEPSTSHWKTLDTIHFNSKGDTSWAENTWESEDDASVHTVFCPCGCGWPIVEYQDRINDQGIIQRRHRITNFEYHPAPKTNFQHKLDSLK